MDLLSKVVRINKLTGDTLSYVDFSYENGKIQKKVGKVLSNSEITVFDYNELGKLVSSESIMTSISSLDTMQIEFKEYDDKERLIYLRRNVRGKEDIYSWDYQKDFILLKKEFEIFEKENFEQIIEFDDKLQITKIIKKLSLPDGEEVETITRLQYNENDLFSGMTIDNKQIIAVKYIKY
ncbi:hypothetical protein G3O08_04845 [Cryomorpha ignava]|uniref:Uncharacterized protein n=1 Tax=Cryomorpha ignava TaxID=101383 RepID=A0A7K3WMF7_9FLAO|nr:hypothetical protein [Cryomorpha ignava]NEN22827.1 hypothetical protein [Cryomorpha ignava]